LSDYSLKAKNKIAICANNGDPHRQIFKNIIVSIFNIKGFTFMLASILPSGKTTRLD